MEAFLERRQEGCRVLFAAVQEPARRTLQRVGILRAVGEENIYPSLDEALLRAEEILEEEKRKTGEEPEYKWVNGKRRKVTDSGRQAETSDAERTQANMERMRRMLEDMNREDGPCG